MALIDVLFRELKKREVEVVYAGEDKLSLRGKTANVDETLMKAVKAFKPRLLEILKPAVRDAADAANDPENTIRPIRCEECSTTYLVPQPYDLPLGVGACIYRNQCYRDGSPKCPVKAGAR